MSNTKFLTIYLIFMVPTYIYRFALIGAALENEDPEAMGAAMYVWMFISYAAMAFVSYRRGKAIDKGHLVAFPIVGAVFDIILVFVPLIPTVMNIITIVIGMEDSKPVENHQPKTAASTDE